MSRLLCFADLHLGAGSNLGRIPGDRLADQEQVLERLITLADVRNVDAILFAGDLLEGPTITPEQLEVFGRQVERLEGRIPLIAVSGNSRHDLALQPTNALQPLRHVPGVHVYSQPGLYELPDATIACLPWVSPARLVARYGGTVDRDRINEQAASLWVRAAAELCDPTIKPTVLLFHGSISGAGLPTGISTDELREPVVPLDELLEVGYAAVVAGHIHQPQYTVGEDGWHQPPDDLDVLPHEIATPLPLALYTGSPMPLNFGEVGTQHGAWVIDLGSGLTRAEFVPTESRPLRQASFDLAALASGSVDPVSEFDGILDPAAWPDVADAIVKVSLRVTKAQQRRLDLAGLRAAVLGAGAHTVKIEVESAREDRARVESVTDELEPVEAFDAWTVANGLWQESVVVAARERMLADLDEVAA